MKMKLVKDFDEHRKKGDELEIDKIRYDDGYAGRYAVRIVNSWKRPKYLAITWFIKVPYEMT